MSTAKRTLTVRGIDIEVVYKDIKNLHIGVYPPAGRVRVAAPRRLDEDRVRLAVIQRLPWIKQQQKQLQDAVRQSEREMVTGESHYVWGTRLRLRVIERPGRAHVEVDHDRLLLYMPEGSDQEARTKVLQRWHRSELRRAIPPLISKWEPTDRTQRVAVGHQADEDQVGVMQPRVRPHLDQPRTGQEAPALP